ncbi:MAG TPA: hypothetical protein EYG16_03875 [Deltaproteobacteria bacterium]|nr:hypothetical protein [Deltaproteobacteria bacterium]
MDNTQANEATGSSDTEIFMTAVAGLCMVFVFGGVIFWGLKAGGDAAGYVTLLALIAPVESVRPLYFAFVMFPALVAFLAVGVPVLVRVLLRMRQAQGRDRAFLLALALCCLLLYVDRAAGLASILGLLLALGIGLRGGLRTVRRLATKLAGGLCLLTASSLVLLTWMGAGVQAGAPPGVAVLPTLVMLTCFLLLLSMVSTVLAKLGPLAIVAAILLWCAALAWYPLAVTGTELLVAAVDMQAPAGLVMIFVLVADGALLVFARRSMGQA